MRNHEKLKIICDKIWYKIDLYKDINWYWIIKDVREIIFTQDFMDLFECNCDNLAWKYWRVALLKNLDNPVEFLFDLLELWKII